MCISHDGHSRRPPRRMKILHINHNCSFEKGSEKAISMSYTFYLNQVVLSYSLSPPNGLHFRTAQPHDNVLGLLQNGLWEAETSFQDFRWKRLTENTYIETNTRCSLTDGFLTKAIPHTATKKAIFVSYSLCDCSCFSFLQSQQR